MSLSRGFHLFRQIQNTTNKNSIIKQQIRNSSEGWVYRTTGHHYNATWFKVAEVNMTLAWWWWLWHLYHEYEWIIGEWDVPDPKKWTDAELGIPPDN